MPMWRNRQTRWSQKPVSKGVQDRSLLGAPERASGEEETRRHLKRFVPQVQLPASPPKFMLPEPDGTASRLHREIDRVRFTKEVRVFSSVE